MHPAPLPRGPHGTLVKLINPSLSRHPAGCSELPPPSQSLELLCFKLLPPKLPKPRTSHQSAGASEGKGVGFRVYIRHKNRGCKSNSFTWIQYNTWGREFSKDQRYWGHFVKDVPWVEKQNYWSKIIFTTNSHAAILLLIGVFAVKHQLVSWDLTLSPASSNHCGSPTACYLV